MTDIEKLKELEAKATRGRWKVFATEREFVGGHTRQVYQIRTEKRHPQLKDHYPVVCECEQNLKDGQKHGIWLSKDDSAFIVAMRNALPALLASLASKEGENARLKAERDEARELYDFAALARDTVGYLGSVASCIMETDARAASAESRLTTALAALGEAEQTLADAVEQIAIMRESLEYKAQQHLMNINNTLAEALEPFARFFDWARRHEWPAAITEDDMTPVYGREDPTGETEALALYVGHFRKARAAIAKLNALEGNEDG